jgi:hypothetical protein
VNGRWTVSAGSIAVLSFVSTAAVNTVTDPKRVETLSVFRITGSAGG